MFFRGFPRAVETERGLLKAQKTVGVLNSHQKTLRDYVSFMNEDLLSVRVERANLHVGLDEMTALVQRMMDDSAGEANDA